MPCCCSVSVRSACSRSCSRVTLTPVSPGPSGTPRLLAGVAEVFRSRSRLARGARLALSASVAVSALALVVFHAALFWNQIGRRAPARPGSGGALGHGRAAAGRTRGVRPRGRAVLWGRRALVVWVLVALLHVTAAPATDLGGITRHGRADDAGARGLCRRRQRRRSCLRPRSSLLLLLRRPRRMPACTPARCACGGSRPPAPTRQSSASTSPRARLPSRSPDRARPAVVTGRSCTSARGLPRDAHVRCARCRAGPDAGRHAGTRATRTRRERPASWDARRGSA